MSKTPYWIWITTLLFVPAHNLFQNIFDSVLKLNFESIFLEFQPALFRLLKVNSNLALRLLRSWQISFSGMLFSRDGCDIMRYILLLLWCVRDTGPRVIACHMSRITIGCCCCQPSGVICTVPPLLSTSLAVSPASDPPWGSLMPAPGEDDEYPERRGGSTAL